MIRRFLCILIFAAMLLCLPLFPHAHAADQSALLELMTRSCLYNERVDLSGFNLNEDSLDAAFCTLQYSGAIPWYVNSYQYTHSPKGTILTFSPLGYDKAEYDYGLYEKAVAELLNEAVYDGMSQYQIALSVHDTIIANAIYDESLEKNTNYDILVNGTAVCAGYAMAYLDIMTRLGMECRMVISEEMNHGWNLVKIDGSWYHVDLTWDDPSPDSYGLVMHDHFLLTDEQIRNKEHYGWDTDITCTDTRFTDAFWRGVDSRIIYTGANHCFIRNEKDWSSYIVSQEESSGSQTTLHTMRPQYINIGDGSFAYEHNGLSYWNGRLWFSSMNAVYSMLPDGSDMQTVYRYDTGANKRYIYGSHVEDSTLYLTLSDKDFNCISDTVSLAVTANHEHSYTSQTLEATCTEDGGTYYTCICGVHYETDVTAATGHTYESQVQTPATCNQEGTMEYICTVCDHSYTEPYLDPEVHDYTSEVSYPATLFRGGANCLTCIHCGSTTYEPIDSLTLVQWVQQEPGEAAGVSGTVIGFILLRSAMRMGKKRKEKQKEQ